MRRLVEENSSGDLGITPDGRTLVFARSSMHQPAEIYTAAANGSGLTARTHHNDALLSAIEMNKAEEFWFDGATSSPGTPKIHSWILKPPQFDATRKYPVLLLVHGGPQGAWDDSWGFRWNPQMYAAAGYLVVMPNPRGSTGYGQQLDRRNQQRLGWTVLQGFDACDGCR